MDLEAIFDAYSAHHVDMDDLHPVAAHYVRCRLAGTSASLAEQFATGSTPELKGTNAQFTAGWSTEDQFNSHTQIGKHLDEKYRAEAKRLGVSTTGRRYSHQAARYAGDPQAWIADSSDMLRLAREQNFSLDDGLLSYKAEARDPADDPKQTGRPAAA